MDLSVIEIVACSLLALLTLFFIRMEICYGIADRVSTDLLRYLVSPEEIALNPKYFHIWTVKQLTALAEKRRAARMVL